MSRIGKEPVALPAGVTAGDFPREAIVTLNDSWGYKTTDHHWKSPAQIRQIVLDAMQSGANLLVDRVISYAAKHASEVEVSGYDSGYDDEDGWIGDKYTFADEKAVDITFATLRDPKRAVGNKTYLLGDENTVLGSTLMWNLGSGTPAEIVEAAREVWQFRCDVFNGDKTDADFEEYQEQKQKEAEEAAAAAAAAEEAEEAPAAE